MAQQFIVGADAKDALPEITKLWRSGVETTVDLLGEATVSETEADRYMQRCEETLRALASAATKPGQVNLSVKVSALTPLLRPTAPERGIEGARPRLEHLLRVAKEVGAHLHVDMESFDTREAITELTLDLLSQPEFADGPSAGIVLQAYLTESPEYLEHLLTWAENTPRKHPFVIRLVKGAYWDHEVVQAAQNGWAPPVFTDRRECDRNFEALTKRLIDARSTVRVAIASHNLRSISHAAAYADAKRVGNEDLEFQILRGLGDDTQAAIAATGRQVRAYCPVGDLVAGMAYLVRRLLENTANDSFLAATPAAPTPPSSSRPRDEHLPQRTAARAAPRRRPHRVPHRPRRAGRQAPARGADADRRGRRPRARSSPRWTRAIRRPSSPTPMAPPRSTPGTRSPPPSAASSCGPSAPRRARRRALARRRHPALAPLRARGAGRARVRQAVGGGRR